MLICLFIYLFIYLFLYIATTSKDLSLHLTNYEQKSQVFTQALPKRWLSMVLAD